jgi:hypothetical protein
MLGKATSVDINIQHVSYLVYAIIFNIHDTLFSSSVATFVKSCGFYFKKFQHYNVLDYSVKNNGNVN